MTFLTASLLLALSAVAAFRCVLFLQNSTTVFWPITVTVAYAFVTTVSIFRHRLARLSCDRSPDSLVLCLFGKRTLWDRTAATNADGVGRVIVRTDYHDLNAAFFDGRCVERVLPKLTAASRCYALYHWPADRFAAAFGPQRDLLWQSISVTEHSGKLPRHVLPFQCRALYQKLGFYGHMLRVYVPVFWAGLVGLPFFFLAGFAAHRWPLCSCCQHRLFTFSISTRPARAVCTTLSFARDALRLSGG